VGEASVGLQYTLVIWDVVGFRQELSDRPIVPLEDLQLGDDQRGPHQAVLERGCQAVDVVSVPDDQAGTQRLAEDSVERAVVRAFVDPIGERRVPTPLPSHYIAHRGACGKPRVVPYTRRQRPEPTDMGGATCVCWCRRMGHAGASNWWWDARRRCGHAPRRCGCAPPDVAELLARAGVPVAPVGQPVRPLVTGATPPAADLPWRAAELVAAVAEGCDALVATGVMPAMPEGGLL